MNKPIKADDWLDAIATRVESDGPQALDLEGHTPMVLVPLDTYRQMEKRRPTLLELLRQMDWSDVDLSRDPRPAREIDFLKFLLDTNAISELGRPRPDEGFVAWHDAQGEVAEREESVFLSVLLVGEMDKGILSLPEGRKRARLAELRDQILSEYGNRILPLDLVVARRWAEVAERHRALGLKIDAIDELIAATALVHELTLVTRNVRHFEHSGCKLLSPWNA